MNAALVFKSLLAWCFILCLAIANGALREAVLIPHLGRTVGLVVSGLSLSLLVLLTAIAFGRLAGGFAAQQGMFIGTLWLGLTLSFEFGFGRFAQHQSWSELFEAYTFKDGNLWPVVLAITFLAPSLVARRRSR